MEPLYGLKSQQLQVSSCCISKSAWFAHHKFYIKKKNNLGSIHTFELNYNHSRQDKAVIFCVCVYPQCWLKYYPIWILLHMIPRFCWEVSYLWGHDPSLEFCSFVNFVLASRAFFFFVRVEGNILSKIGRCIWKSDLNMPLFFLCFYFLHSIPYIGSAKSLSQCGIEIQFFFLQIFLLLCPMDRGALA